jgi:fused signal recognition particle receptor
MWLVLQDPLRPTTSDGQQVPPGAQHAVPQGTEQPASPLPPPLLLEPVPLLPPLLVELPPLPPLLPLSCFGAASSPESGPSPASMGAPLLPAPLLLGPPLPAPPLDVPLDESLEPPLPPLEVLAPLPLPPSTPPVLAPASDVSVPSPDKLKGLPPHSSIATAMASQPRARARFRRMTWFLQGTLGNL